MSVWKNKILFIKVLATANIPSLVKLLSGSVTAPTFKSGWKF